MKIYADNRNTKSQLYDRLVGQDLWLHVTFGWTHYYMRFLEKVPNEFPGIRFQEYVVNSFRIREDEIAPFFPELTAGQKEILFSKTTIYGDSFDPVYPLEMYTTEELFK